MGCGCGCKEHKFDCKSYFKLYPDLQKNGLTKCCQAYKHFKTYGINEKRLSNLTSNLEAYKNKYSDLKHMTHEQAWIHYVTHGKNEGRVMQYKNIH